MCTSCGFARPVTEPELSLGPVKHPWVLKPRRKSLRLGRRGSHGTKKWDMGRRLYRCQWSIANLGSFFSVGGNYRGKNSTKWFITGEENMPHRSHTWVNWDDLMKWGTYSHLMSCWSQRSPAVQVTFISQAYGPISYDQNQAHLSLVANGFSFHLCPSVRANNITQKLLHGPFPIFTGGLILSTSRAG